eukprot:6480258-Amphidinium_carterae.1
MMPACTSTCPHADFKRSVGAKYSHLKPFCRQRKLVGCTKCPEHAARCTLVCVGLTKQSGKHVSSETSHAELAARHLQVRLKEDFRDDRSCSEVVHQCVGLRLLQKEPQRAKVNTSCHAHDLSHLANIL